MTKTFFQISKIFVKSVEILQFMQKMLIYEFHKNTVAMLNKICKYVTLSLKAKYEIAQLGLCKYKIEQLLVQPPCNKLTL